MSVERLVKKSSKLLKDLSDSHSVGGEWTECQADQDLLNPFKNPYIKEQKRQRSKKANLEHQSQSTKAFEDKRFSLPVIKTNNSKIVQKLLQNLTPQKSRHVSLPMHENLNIIDKIDLENRRKEEQKELKEFEQNHRALVENSLKGSQDLSSFEHYIFNQLQNDCETQMEQLKQDQLPLYKQQHGSSKPNLLTEETHIAEMNRHNNGRSKRDYQQYSILSPGTGDRYGTPESDQKKVKHVKGMMGRGNELILSNQLTKPHKQRGGNHLPQ